MAKLTYFGHGSFKLVTSDNIVIYIDPFYKGDYSRPADLALITHEHYDHNRLDLLNMANGSTVIRAADCLPDYKTFIYKGITIKSTPAKNENHKSGCVGFVVMCDDKRLYFAGDTSKTQYMSSLKDIDYAFLPTDGIYNMGPLEATECADIIGAKYSVPVHTERPEEEFNEFVANKFTPKNKLIIKPGTEIEL